MTSAAFADPRLQDDDGDDGPPNEFTGMVPDLADFENAGDVVGAGGGPRRDRGGDSYYAYSTILAKGLKSQDDTLIEFLKTAALTSDMQKICVDNLVTWFNFVFNAPVCNRYGLIAFTKRCIKDLAEEAEDIEDAAERTQALDDIAAARQRAGDYTAARALVAHLERQSTRGRSREEVEDLQGQRAQALADMDAADRAAMALYPGARDTYGHQLYLRWVEDWIAEDERAGRPVAQYDYTDLKRRLAKKEITLLDCLEDLPLPLQKSYQVCQVSLSSGEPWRNMFVLGITNGFGVMPPEDSAGKKKWYERFSARSMSSHHGRDRRARPPRE